MSDFVLERKGSFGQGYSLTLVDRFGVYLSARQIRRWIGSFQNLRVGDFGCGYQASFARTVLSEASQIYLADLRLADELKKHPQVTALEGQLPAVLSEIPSNSLDVALCLSVLEHLSDAQGMVSELHRVTCPGGTLLLNVPNWVGKYFLEFSAFRLGLSPKEEMDDHKMYYGVKDLWPLLVKAGFRPSQIRCFSHKFGLNTFAVCKKNN